MTTLCFDFGNTRLKCAVFEGSGLREILVLTEDSPAVIEQLIHQYKPATTLLSSVINHSPQTEACLQKHTHFHKLNHQSKLPIILSVGKPETIGADRIGLVVAAADLFPERHNLVIGLGSCITFNFINKFHEFLGGSISPGLEMRFKVMHQLTAKLPLIQTKGMSKEIDFPLVGHDTRTNLLSGVILGMSKEIDGIIDLYKEKYDNLNVLLTGGDMNFFLPYLKNELIADEGLMYKGLYVISRYNG